MVWKIGPLPRDAWGYGGVVPVGVTDGFYFADFCGETVMLVPSGEILEPHEIAWYDNSLELPSASAAGAKRLEY